MCRARALQSAQGQAQQSRSVLQVSDLSAVPFSSRELMLVKVKCNAAQRFELTNLAEIFHGNVCDVSLTTMTLEIQGKEDKMQAVQTLLAPYGKPCKAMPIALEVMPLFQGFIGIK